eukprot:Hpha_TRINITY_DN13909_c0_g1::TRINITY_DN13909_c0_g1_i1::g.35459::m.35459
MEERNEIFTPLSSAQGVPTPGGPSPVPGTTPLAPVASCQALTQTGIAGWNTAGLDAQVTSGNALAYLCARVTSTLTEEERVHADLMLPLSHFDDELVENGVITLDLADPANEGMTLILTKAKYMIAGLKPDDATPAAVATVEYQRACQPGQVKIWDDARTASEAVHADGSRTFRMTKTIIPFVLQFTIQLRASQVPSHRLAALAPMCDGRVPHKALLMERTKRDRYKRDAIEVCKSIVLYHWQQPGMPCEIHHVTVCCTRSLPSPVARIIHTLGGMAAKEVGETALRTRQWFAANPVHGVLAEAADWEGMESPRSEIDDLKSLISDATPRLQTPYTPANGYGPLVTAREHPVVEEGETSPRIQDRIKEFVKDQRVSATTTVVLLGAAAVTGGAMPIVAVGCVGGALIFSGITGASIARTGFGQHDDEWREQSLRFSREGSRLQDYQSGDVLSAIRWEEDPSRGDEDHVYGELTLTLRRRVSLRMERSRLQDLRLLADNCVDHNLPVVRDTPALRNRPRERNREAKCNLCCCQ